MNLLAIMPARNEGWVIGLSARAALMWCDSLVVLEHASKDDTEAILAQLEAEYPGRVTILAEPDATWEEMSHRQRLLDEARARGASHVAIVDADEVLSGNLLGSIRGMIETLQPGQFLQIPMRIMHRSTTQYRSDRSAFGNAITTIAFADAPGLGWRNAGGYPHHHREPYGAVVGQRLYPSQLEGGVMHLQFANWRRLLAKQTWYQCMEAVRFPEKPISRIAAMYSLSMNETGLEVTPAPSDWWGPYRALMSHLDRDREPWHEAEVDAMFEQYGLAKFEGLNLQYQPEVAV